MEMPAVARFEALHAFSPFLGDGDAQRFDIWREGRRRAEGQTLRHVDCRRLNIPRLGGDDESLARFQGSTRECSALDVSSKGSDLNP